MTSNEDCSLSHPRLPPELEREIFVLATRTDPTNKFVYLVICRRAHAWIEPIIYETVVQINRPGKEKPFSLTSRQAHHVRTLVVAGLMSSNAALDIIRRCPNLNSLGFWTHIRPNVLTVLSQLPLRRLSTNFCKLSGKLWEPINFTSLRNLSHIEFTDHCGSWELIKELTELPNLTHLAFDSDILPEVLETVLVHLPGLKVLVSLTFHVGEGETVESKERSRTGLKNRRLVYLTQSSYMDRLVGDWVGAARNGVDFWMIAETIIRNRTRKEWDSGINR